MRPSTTLQANSVTWPSEAKQPAKQSQDGHGEEGRRKQVVRKWEREEEIGWVCQSILTLKESANYMQMTSLSNNNVTG